MPKKPSPTFTRHGRTYRNPKANALSGRSARHDASHQTPQNQQVGALQLGNSDIVSWINETWLGDIEAGNRTHGRYTRVTRAAMAHFGCSHATAERAYRDAELIRAAEAEERRPLLQARVEEQLQRIADREEEANPGAAIAALTVLSRIGGLFAPAKLEVTHDAEPALQLDAILGALSDRGLAALDVVLAEIEAAKAAGRLALPTSGGDVIDVPVVETDN